MGILLLANAIANGPWSVALQLCIALMVKEHDPTLFGFHGLASLGLIVGATGMGDVIGNLTSRRGHLQSMEARGGTQIINARVPLAEMFQYSTALRGMTQGRGTYTMEPAEYSPVPEAIGLKIRKEIEAVAEELKK